MCNNKYPFNSPKAEHYRFLGECTALLLQEKSLQEISTIKGISVNELLENFEELKEVNPTLYQQVCQMKDSN